MIAFVIDAHYPALHLIKVENGSEYPTTHQLKTHAATVRRLAVLIGYSAYGVKSKVNICGGCPVSGVRAQPLTLAHIAHPFSAYPNSCYQQQDGGASKNAGLELLWTHRYPFAGDDPNVLNGNGSNSVQSAASLGSAAPAGSAKPQTGNRAPRSGGVEAGGVGALGGTGGGAAVTAAVAADQARGDRTVTALCFHQYNGDVLAVGYGAFFFSPSVHKGGAVLFWSVSYRRCIEDQILRWFVLYQCHV